MMFALGSASLDTVPPAVVIPLVLLFLFVYVRIVIFFINDLYRPDRHVYGGNKDIWAMIIILFSVVGIMAYVYMGRVD